MSENKSSSSSWEDLANEIAPAGVRPAGLATGAWRKVAETGGTMLPPEKPRQIVCPPCDSNARLDEGLGGQERVCNALGKHYFISRPASEYDANLRAVVPRLESVLHEKRIPRLPRTQLDDL